MIQNIRGSGNIYVGVAESGMPYVDMNAPSAGMMRYNGNMRAMEVYNGSVWLQLYGSSVELNLDNISQTALQWAVKKMEQERKWEELAKDSKAVQIALDNLEQARQQLEITAHLAKEEHEIIS